MSPLKQLSRWLSGWRLAGLLCGILVFGATLSLAYVFYLKHTAERTVPHVEIIGPAVVIAEGQAADYDVTVRNQVTGLPCTAAILRATVAKERLPEVATNAEGKARIRIRWPKNQAPRGYLIEVRGTCDGSFLWGRFLAQEEPSPYRKTIGAPPGEADPWALRFPANVLTVISTDQDHYEPGQILHFRATSVSQRQGRPVARKGISF